MNRQRGAALIVILLILGVVGAYFALKALNGGQAGRDIETANTLAKAKDALIGFAATYPENDSSHVNEVFGYLPCPDNDNNGDANTPCGTRDVSEAGRLPWSTLKLPPLRDGHGECLWYAVSGTAKDNPKTLAFNWDTVGQFVVQDAAGKVLTSTDPHQRPLAVIVAPHQAVANQTRPSAAASVCGGSTVLTDYLEGATLSPVAEAVSTLTLSTPDSVAAGTNNDRGLWITPDEVFARIRQRGDFVPKINALLDRLETCLETNPPLPPYSAINKGMGDYPSPGPDTVTNDVLTRCNPTDPADQSLLKNWQDNLLYTGPVSGATVNGVACDAVLIFGGARAAGQSRANATERSIVANYLEGTNATIFPGGGAYTGASTYNAANPSADVVRCITGSGPPPPPPISGFGNFNPSGVGVTINPDGSADIEVAGGSSGGCLWYKDPIPLAGKTLRTYFGFRFSSPDPVGGNDLGYGFAQQLVRGDLPTPPNTCGSQQRMGVLPVADAWGSLSHIIETDIYDTGGDGDPNENHTAIMLNGNLDHSLSGTMTTACNGSASGCRHSPANRFEESPLQDHSQRVEVKTGCNSTCTVCTPASHGSLPTPPGGNTYARITAWVDCVGAACSDVTSDIDRLAHPPTVQRCTLLFPQMNTIYFGFTGGFSSGGGGQGVTLKNFTLRYD